MSLRLAIVLGMVLMAQGVMTPGGGIGTGDISRDDYGGQRPTQSPQTLERACTTRVGICRIANLVPPGQPCYCVANDGTRLDGYAIAWRWSPAPPFELK